MTQIPEDSPILHPLVYVAVDFILASIGIGFTLGLGITVLNGTIGVPISRKVTTEAISAVAFLGAYPFVSRR